MFAILIYIEYIKPQPISWTLNFSKHSKIPYGCYVLHKLLPEIFTVEIADETDGFWLRTKKYKINKEKNHVIITSSFDADKMEIESMFSELKSGSDVFISALNFDVRLLDTLHLKHTAQWSSMIPELKGKKTKVYFTNSQLKSWKSYAVESNYSNYFFQSFDTSVTTLLGTDEYGRANFIRLDIGKGRLFLHTLPMVFTNYNLLFGNAEYAFKTLNHLKNQHTIWDEFYKPEKPIISTPLRYVLSQPALKIAWFLLLFTVVLYVVFEARRRQRIIPIIKPPNNTSMEFAETVGRLYLNHANHRDLALKKFNYFCDTLRKKYHITGLLTDEKSQDLLAEKTGVEKADIEKIFFANAAHISSLKISAEALIQFNKMIEDFFEKAK